MGRIQIDDKTKIQISIILKYYRKRAKLKQRDFITYNGVTVCSADTYSRIENKQVIKSNSIYVYLLYQIGATYTQTSDFWDSFSNAFNDLLNAVTFYNIDEIANIANEIKKKLPDINDIFVMEVKSLMDIIPVYYAQCSELSRDNYEKYLSLYVIFHESLQEILKDMLFTYIVNRQRSCVESRKVFDYLQIDKSTHPLNILNRSYQYFYDEMFLDCFKDSLQLEQIFLKMHNYNRLLDVYDAIVLLYTEVQRDKGNQVYKEKLLSLVEEHKDDLHPNKYKQSLYQIGMLFYESKHYEEAYPYFVSLAKIDDYHYLPAALLANLIASKLDFVIDSAVLKKPRFRERFPLHVLNFHEYFIKKANSDNYDELEDYFLQEVAPNIQQSNNLLWEPMVEEMKKIVKVTKHYYNNKKILKNRNKR